MAGQVSYGPTVEDAVTANLLRTRHSKQRRIIRWVATASLLLGIGNMVSKHLLGDGWTHAAADSVVMLAVGLVLLAMPLTTPWFFTRALRRSFAQRPNAGDPVEVRWDDDALSLTTIQGHIAQPWRTLHRWIADADVFVALPSDLTLLSLPWRVLNSEQRDDLLNTARRFGPAPG